MTKGQRFIVTTGEYSDYGIRDSFVCLKTFSFDKALDEWLARHPNEYGDRSFGYSGPGDQGFLDSLRKLGLIADAPLTRIHLHNYGTAEESPAGDAEDEP